MSDFWNENPNPQNNPERPEEQQETPASSTPRYYTPSQPDRNFQPNDPQPQWNYNQYTTPGNGPKKPNRNRGLVVFTVLLCSVLLIAMLCLAGVGLYSLVKQHTGEEVLPPTEVPSVNDPENPNIAPEPGIELDLQEKPQNGADVTYEDGRLPTTEVAKRVTPVVVSIIEYGSYQGQMYSGSGSGIIMSSDGYIITNAHVVSMPDGSAANGLEVVLSDGTRLEAWLVGADSRTDLAVIKVDATDLPYAEFGNSDQMEIGETVIAIGSPGGEDLSSSVSQGIISGLNRQIKTSSEGYSINCIQTDAAINPGNSGGPLVNQFGQVIGINSAKLVDTQYEGIGFAIPMNDAKPIIDQLITYGRVTDRARLGITGVAITYSFSQYYSLPQGLLIISTDV